MKPFEIFRVGRHTAMSGDTLSFGEAELASVASSYDVALHHAPIVVGHPKQDAPAYGWVDGLTFTDGCLVAAPADVDAGFADLVKAKRFRKVSAAFYRPDAPNNPAPGHFYLRHVGFLGAAPPAVKGLKPIEFGEEDGTLVVEFADWQLSRASGVVARLMRGLRDFIIERDGTDKADQVLPSWDIDQLASISDEAARDAQPVFVDPTTTREDPMTDKQAPTEADLERRAADLQQREAAFAEREQARRAVEDAAFVAGVVEQGRLPIGLKEAATALFAELGDAPLTFGEGDGQRTEAPRALFRELLSSLPPPVQEGEVANGAAGQSVDFSDAVALATLLTTEVETARGNGETLSPADALARIQRGQK